MEKLAQTEERETGRRNAAFDEPAFVPNEGNEGMVAPEEQPRTSLLGRPHALGVMLGLAIVAAIVVFSLWKYYSVRESTDDAQIEAHIHPISAKVGGTVVTVNVTEGRRVEAGQVLVEIDPKDYQVALERAEADRAEAEAILRGSRADLPITTTSTSSQLSGAEAGVLEARANLASSEKEITAAEAQLRAAQAKIQENQAMYQKAQRDLERMNLLIAKQEISQQQYDATMASTHALRAAVESAQAEAANSEQGLRVAQSHADRDRAKVAQAEAIERNAGTGPQQVEVTQSRAQSAQARLEMAQASLDQAQLNMQYTKIVAPVGGIIGRKNVESGQIVQAGQPLFTIVALDNVWVMANFKETQLKDIRPGQPAVITVDAYGGHKFKGHVDSIAGATGAKFSLLPPENATGNYVKVVQRVPVKIVLEPGEDPEHLLRPGMSAEPTVFTK